MKKFMPKILFAMAMLVGGTFVLQTVQPFAEKTVEAAADSSSVHLTEGDVFTYGTYTPIAGTNAGVSQPLRWRIVYANEKTGEGVAMTEQPIEQASQGWNTNCYYANRGSGNCTSAPWTFGQGASNQNLSIITTARGAAANNQAITGTWQNAYFGGSVADWMDRYFVPNFVGSIQGSAFGTYVGYYDGANKDQYHAADKQVTVLVDWQNSDGTRALATSNGADLTTKPYPRTGSGSDTTGMYNPYIYTMPFAYTRKAGMTTPDKNGNGKIDADELTENGFPIDAQLDATTGLPVGETYGSYQYPSTWISYSTISVKNNVVPVVGSDLTGTQVSALCFHANEDKLSWYLYSSSVLSKGKLFGISYKGSAMYHGGLWSQSYPQRPALYTFDNHGAYHGCI